MCTFPRQGWDIVQAKGRGPDFAVGYFNECFNGCEHQVAGHMIREGLTLEGLAVERAVHDRYHPSRRNPWNEIECGDHYARSMASYGVFLGACGFEYHGPKQHIGFAPKLSPENFKCAFTSAEGWGAFAQKMENGNLKAELAVRWGRLKLKTIALEKSEAASVRASWQSNNLPATFAHDGKRVVVTLEQGVEIAAGQALEISIT